MPPAPAGTASASAMSSLERHARARTCRAPTAASRRPRASRPSRASCPAPRGRRRARAPADRAGRRAARRRRRPRCRARARPGPGRSTPTPSAAAAQSPAPAATGTPAAVWPETSGDSSTRGIHAVGHARARPAPALEKRRSATSKSSVPGGVGDVDRPLAAEPQPHVVLGQQHVADARVDLGLVRAQPQQLGRREARQRAVAGQRDQPLEADAPLDLGALGGRALVVPEDRRAQHALVLVERDEAVHLAREADARRPRAAPSAAIAASAARPPVLGRLLRPAGPRLREAVVALGARDDRPVGADRQRLDAGRADVEADGDRAVIALSPGSARRARRRRARRRGSRPCATAPRAARRRRCARPPRR